MASVVLYDVERVRRQLEQVHTILQLAAVRLGAGDVTGADSALTAARIELRASIPARNEVQHG